MKALGNPLLAALEKGDAEHLAQLRQGHEVQLQQMIQNVRYLQWKHAEESTNALLASRASALERYTFYLRLLGLTPDNRRCRPTLAADRTELTEDELGRHVQCAGRRVHSGGADADLQQAAAGAGNSASTQSGATGSGLLYLNTNEDAELNTHRPTARDTGLTASIVNATAAVLTVIPDIDVDLHYWGLGAHSKVFGGDLLATAVESAPTSCRWWPPMSGPGRDRR